MNSQTQRASIAGPAGVLQCAIDEPAEAVRGVMVVCHPHPLHGGTMDNKVVQTVARAGLQQGLRTVRFNFRGIGESAGAWDAGQGEVDDALAVIAAYRDAALPLWLAGFSFGGYVASQAAARLASQGTPADGLVLVGPATRNFEVATVPEGTLVIHGEADDVVPLQATLDWARPQSLPVVVVPGVGHFFHGQLPLLKSLVVRHLAAA
ncbi:alpha/beta hydrolase [Aquincola tertiaricarbonis]|uniref:Alpha/beta hydrolase n=1 Tax=Aquincola tertiaricarbonis TaxID=391953 RepID=A0ABY4SEF0_AQUTE|nr:alpha/beta fold hydrolase [Aquincola tertiaricarbonis]URI09680.1 alpha/beta hydrolase [Aquincola tertiaricarbonis]